MLQLALHLTHHRGPRIDYIGIGAAAALSWVGLPGPGEAALIGAGVAAARGHLDIGSVVLYAWAGASVGGLAGWAIGRYGGRRVVLAGRWLHDARVRALEQGNRFFDRFGLLAVYLAPSWVAGINLMRAQRFAVANTVCALAWALVIGLGSYALGPSIGDAAADIGTVATVAIVVLAAGAALLTRFGMRRRRRRSQSAAEEEDVAGSAGTGDSGQL